MHPTVSTLYTIAIRLGFSLDEGVDNNPVAGGRGRPRTGDPVQREVAPVVVMEKGVTWQRLAIMDTAENVASVLATYVAVTLYGVPKLRRS